MLFAGCVRQVDPANNLKDTLPANLLDYSGTPASPYDRTALAFSDQGAWFAYGFPENKDCPGGFSCPYLLT